MKHSELLEKFDYQIAGSKAIGCKCSACDNAITLRAVVELHKPMADWRKSPIKYDVCDCCGWEKTYPCSTIQAIEKELI